MATQPRSMTSDETSGAGTPPLGSQPGQPGPHHVAGQDDVTQPLGYDTPGHQPLGYDTPAQPLGYTGQGYGAPTYETQGYGAQGYGTPTYGAPGYGTPAQDVPTGVHQDAPWSTQPLPGYTAADFPAPAGVTTLAPAPAVAARPRRRIGSLLVAASLAAVVGAGAGVGSFAYLTDGGAAGAVSPISVTTVPAAQTPVLDGTVVAAADKIQPSVVTITVQAGQGGDIGSGVVLDDQGHILTNKHVVSAAAGSRPGWHGGHHHRDLPQRDDGAGAGRRHLADQRPRRHQGRRGRRPHPGRLRQVRLAAGRPGRRRRRRPARPVGVGDQRHRLQHRPPGPLGRRRRRGLPRGADRRGHQPRQLRRPAGRPQRRRGRDQLLDRQHRLQLRQHASPATSGSASPSRPTSPRGSPAS